MEGEIELVDLLDAEQLVGGEEILENLTQGEDDQDHQDQTG